MHVFTLKLSLVFNTRIHVQSYYIVSGTKGENFSKSLLTKQINTIENFGEPAGRPSVVSMYMSIYIGDKKLVNCAPFSKFFPI